MKRRGSYERHKQVTLQRVKAYRLKPENRDKVLRWHVKTDYKLTEDDADLIDALVAMRLVKRKMRSESVTQKGAR